MDLVRRHSLATLLAMCVFAVPQALGQSFTWTPIATDLPPSVKVYSGTASGPIKAYYAEIDYSDTLVDALALRSTTTAKKEAVSSFAAKAKAYVAINGGFFDVGSGASYSLVVSDGRLIDKQLASVSRTAGTYPLVRANFGVMTDRSLETAWVYHYGNELSGVYKFLQPLAHTQSTIAPAPQQADGFPWAGVFQAIGGGPNLVSSAAVNVTYDQEVMFGSGVGRDNGDPRTAIGYTLDGKIILFVVDGRQSSSIGMSLPQVAQTMINLGCVEAINVDGGGSSTFYAGGELRNTPSDGSERQVASAFAIVPHPSYDRQMDTNDPGYSETGSGWITTIDAGYFGTQQTRIVQAGDGSKYATYRFQIPAEAQCEVYAWWTSSVIRSTNTPFIVYSKGRLDTVRVNQTANGGKWNLIGTFTFSGGLDSVVVSNDAVGNSSTAFIALDGLRVLSYDRSIAVGVQRMAVMPGAFELDQNFPNPFNPHTTIRYRLSVFGNVSLRIYDLLGRVVATLVDRDQAPGEYRITWDASAQPSGLYFCELTQNASLQVKRMLLVR